MYHANITNNWSGVDFESKSIRCKDIFKGTELDMDYDYLIIATGARNNTFGVPGVNEVGRRSRENGMET